VSGANHACYPVCRYIGRVDTQVKLRGFRLELGEVEAVLASVPGVQDAVVLVQDADKPGAKLVAYVTPEAADEAAMLAAAHAKLPHYMVPSAFVWLAELPRLPSGKVARKALPRSDATADDTVFVAPRTPLEQAVHDAWQQTLHTSEPVSVYANFFQMGGNSLQAGALCSRLRAVLDSKAAIPIVWVLECQTIEALAARLVDAGAVSALSALPPLTATISQMQPGKSLGAPLSFEQVRFHYNRQCDEGKAEWCPNCDRKHILDSVQLKHTLMT
jgi:AMP-binding enzyme C-terminal domain/Phosphopantetheine attachment site